jgi:cytosine/adenosine deaminase-related metal-dependent hydrolase
MATTNIVVGIGVDGSASNDTSNMIREIRQAMLLQRVRYGAESFSARDALYLATMGGAEVLHRQDEIGSIEVGKAADLISFDMSGIEYAGAQADPLAAIVHCGTERVDTAMVNGEIRVLEGRLVDESLYGLIPRHNEISLRLIG